MDIKPRKRRSIDAVAKKSIPKSVELQPAKPKIEPKIALNNENINARINGLKKRIQQSKIELSDDVKTNKFSVVISVLAAFLALYIYLFRFTNRPIQSIVDTQEFLGIQSLSSIGSNIVYAPQKLIDYLFIKIHFSPVFSLRFASIFFTFLALTMFFFIIKQWVSLRVSAITTFLFATSTWVLFNARDGGFENLLLIVLPIIFITGYVLKNQVDSKWMYLIAPIMAIMLYVPGFIWFFLAGIALHFKDIITSIKANGFKRNSILITLFIIPLLPIFAFGFKSSNSIKLLIGIPNNFIFSVTGVWHNIINTFDQFLLSGFDSRIIWLPNTPLIDAATWVLFSIGVVYVVKSRSEHPDRFLTISIFAVMSLILIFIFGQTYITLLYPLVYLSVAIGITFLLEQWFVIFPKNPVARSVGFGLMTVLVLCISTYHLHRYFFAWANTSRTNQAFTSLTSDTIDTSQYKDFYIR